MLNIFKIRRELSKSQPREKRVSLTFDDGPSEAYTPKILDILKAKDIKATFLLVGKNVEKYPKIAARIAKEGHDIGNHTYSHPVSPLLRFKRKKFIYREITKTDRAIERAIGSRPSLLRPTLAPWDISRGEFLKQAKDLGHQTILWTYSLLDWLGSKSIIKSKAFNGAGKRDSIILMHDGSEKALLKKRDATVDILPKMIDSLRKKSIQFVPLTELLNA
jgi:peptidoglycan-N-acetylglucosamine deacetylase